MQSALFSLFTSMKYLHKINLNLLRPPTMAAKTGEGWARGELAICLLGKEQWGWQPLKAATAWQQNKQTLNE